eukprot:6225528-Amphidinium_carterae.1
MSPYGTRAGDDAHPPFLKCLSVFLLRERAEVNCAPETLRRTDLGDLTDGSLVNLERSMAGSDRT